MNKLIIHASGLDDELALFYALKVVNQGKISKNNTQYCLLTKFENGVVVYTQNRKSGTKSFRIWNSNPAD